MDEQDLAIEENWEYMSNRNILNMTNSIAVI